MRRSISLVLALILCVLIPALSLAAPAFVQEAHIASDSSASTTQAVAFSTQNITSGNLIFVAATWASTSVTASVTDSASNTYTSIKKDTEASQGSHEIFYAKNIAGGGTKPTVTVTFSSAVSFRDLAVIEYSGLNTSSPLDQTASATQSGGGSNATDGVVAGPVTTTANGELIVGAFWNGNVVSDTVNAGTGYSERVNQGNDASHTTQEVEDKIQSSQGSVSATWTQPAGVRYIVLVATFTVPAAAGGASRSLIGVVYH